MSLHSSSSVNGEGSTPKDPLYEILDELKSLKLWKGRKENGVWANSGWSSWLWQNNLLQWHVSVS